MTQPPNIRVEVRIHNVVFQCGLCDKFYNAEKTQGYAIGMVKTLEPSPQNPAILGVPITVLLICAPCYAANKDDKGLGFTEPSRIVLPTQPPVDINKIMKEVKK